MGVMSIGELAAAAGTTTRTVRHYHAVGLLPEPARRSNGYREYDTFALLRLVRIRRLVGLGLSLPEVESALGPDGKQDLREVLGEIAADLANQQRRLAEAQRRIEAVLVREHDLDLAPVVADLMAVVRRTLPGGGASETAIERERTMLSLLEASTAAEVFGGIAEQLSTAADDPDLAARSARLTVRFDALAEAAVDDPAVAEVATELAAMATGFTATGTVDAAGQQLWSDYVASLPPAQASCLSLLESIAPGGDSDA